MKMELETNQYHAFEHFETLKALKEKIIARTGLLQIEGCSTKSLAELKKIQDDVLQLFDNLDSGKKILNKSEAESLEVKLAQVYNELA